MTKFCNQCGTEVGESQRFCNKCGNRLLLTQPAEAAGQPYQAPYQQASYQAPPPAQSPYQPGVMPPAPAYGQATGAGLAANLIGALCYLVTPVTAIIFLVLDPYNKDRFVRFHAWQAIFFAVAWVALKIALGILYFILPNFLVGMMSGLISLGFFLGWLWLMFQAYQNKCEKLPVIGDLAEQQAR